MQDSLLYFKNIFLSLLAMLGLMSHQEIQEHKPEDTSSLQQTVLKESSRTSPKEPNDIIDQNPVTDTEIKTEDFSRIRMFSESFCGPLQALLFRGIISMNIREIDEALDRGADINRATNCIFPLDEAIEGAISKERFAVVEHLCNKGARISDTLLLRLEAKKLLYDANRASETNDNDIVIPIFVPKGTQITAQEIASRKNAWVEHKQGLCDTLAAYLRRKQHEQAPVFQPTAQSTNTAASASAMDNFNPTMAAAKSIPDPKL